MASAENGKMNHEGTTFLSEKIKYKQPARQGCCLSKHTRNCCIATALIGAIVLLLGIVVVAPGRACWRRPS